MTSVVVFVVHVRFAFVNVPVPPVVALSNGLSAAKFDAVALVSVGTSVNESYVAPAVRLILFVVQ